MHKEWKRKWVLSKESLGFFWYRTELEKVSSFLPHDPMKKVGLDRTNPTLKCMGG